MARKEPRALAPGTKCGAKARTNGGQPCRLPAMENGRCRLHGGLTPKGPASVSWKHGRRSRYAIPERLMESTRIVLEDPDVLDLVPNIQLVDAKIQEALNGIAGGGGPAWDAVVDALGRLRAAQTAGDQPGQGRALLELIAAVEAGGKEREAFREIWQLTERRRRLVDTEARRRTADRNSLTVERATGLMYLLVEVVFNHVADQKIRAAIIEDVRRISSRGGELGGGDQ